MVANDIEDDVNNVEDAIAYINRKAQSKFAGQILDLLEATTVSQRVSGVCRLTKLCLKFHEVRFLAKGVALLMSATTDPHLPLRKQAIESLILVSNALGNDDNRLGVPRTVFFKADYVDNVLAMLQEQNPDIQRMVFRLLEVARFPRVQDVLKVVRGISLTVDTGIVEQEKAYKALYAVGERNPEAMLFIRCSKKSNLQDSPFVYPAIEGASSSKELGGLMPKFPGYSSLISAHLKYETEENGNEQELEVIVRAIWPGYAKALFRKVRVHAAKKFLARLKLSRASFLYAIVQCIKATMEYRSQPTCEAQKRMKQRKADLVLPFLGLETQTKKLLIESVEFPKLPTPKAKLLYKRVHCEIVEISRSKAIIEGVVNRLQIVLKLTRVSEAQVRLLRFAVSLYSDGEQQLSLRRVRATNFSSLDGNQLTLSVELPTAESRVSQFMLCIYDPDVAMYCRLKCGQVK